MSHSDTSPPTVFPDFCSSDQFVYGLDVACMCCSWHHRHGLLFAYVWVFLCIELPHTLQLLEVLFNHSSFINKIRFAENSVFRASKRSLTWTKDGQWNEWWSVTLSSPLPSHFREVSTLIAGRNNLEGFLLKSKDVVPKIWHPWLFAKGQ